MSLNNMYHELCHRYIHGHEENTKSAIPTLYKSAFFILQNLHYLRTEKFVGTKIDLLAELKGSDREVLARSLAYSKGESFDFHDSYERLFDWCQQTLRNV
jgi:hypothetical protein